MAGATWPVGKARYGLMLREDGFVMDDGTTARLGETHFLMTTTTANAAKVMQHLELLPAMAVRQPLDVQIVSVTDQWAQLAIAGPLAREVLRAVVDPAHDISNEALPYMQCGGAYHLRRHCRRGCSGCPFRVSWPTNSPCPAHYGAALAERLMQAGALQGIAPYGTEALGVMRIEKGHPAGNELNGQTTAHDLGFGKLLSKRKDFVGRALAARPALTDLARPTLVGLRPVDPAARLRGRRPSAAARRGADRRQRSWSRHLGLLLADGRPVDRPWPAEKRPGPARRDHPGLRSDPERRSAGRGGVAGICRSARQPPPCLRRGYR